MTSASAEPGPYPLAQVAEALGVSDDTVRRWADAGRVRTTRTAAGARAVSGAELARLAVELADARDASGSPSRQSARNRMRGIVTAVTKDTVMAQVEMVCGPYRVVSLLSREAADNLGLAPGSLAYATIKATNVVVEVAR